MLVSSAVCDDGLQLMMTVLKKSKNVSMRTNLTIAFADLTLRFPNLTQPWTHHIYHMYVQNKTNKVLVECVNRFLNTIIVF